MGREVAKNSRMARLRQAFGADIELRGDSIHSNRPWIAVASSRLGRDPLLNRHVCQFLVRCLLDCRQREASLLIAAGSAIESWATRAAELLAVPIVVLSVDPDDESADILVTSRNTDAISRDAVVIALADRVDAVYVRRSGTVERCLRARIKTLCDASTRVAVCLSHQCAAPGLIAEGAIGWFHTSANSDRHTWDNSGKDHCLQEFDRHEHPQENCIWNVTDRWTRTDGRWLIHCTRQCDGAWPGETERQYRDSMILGDGSTLKRTALDTLIRILRSGQLVAGATATAKAEPVVCFSSLPLIELLQRRCFRPQLGRWDYEPYGLAIRLSQAQKMGMQPVIYGQSKDRALLAETDRYRFHPIGKTFDWREEREWRSRKSVNLALLSPEDVRVFAEDLSIVRRRLRDCRWPVTLLSAMHRQPAAEVTNRVKSV